MLRLSEFVRVRLRPGLEVFVVVVVVVDIVVIVLVVIVVVIGFMVNLVVMVVD